MSKRLKHGAVSRFSSIRAKMIFSFGILFIATLIAVEAVRIYGIPLTGIKGEHFIEQASTFKSLNLIADLKKDMLMQWFQGRIDDTFVVAKSDLVKQNLIDLEALIQEISANSRDEKIVWEEIRKDKTFQLLTNYLTTVKKAYTVYSDIDLVDPEKGTGIVSSRDSALGSRLIEDSTLKKIRQSTGYKLMFGIDPMDKILDLNIYTVVRDKTATIAILIMRVNTHDVIKPMLHTGKGLGETGEALLVDQDVRILAPLRHHLPDGTIPEPLTYQITAKPAKFAAHGEEGIIITKDYRNVPVLAAYRHLRITPEMGWGLVVKKDQAEILAPFKSSLLRSFYIILLSTVIVIVIILLIVRNITGPILALNNTAGRIESGDLGARAPVTTSDEIGSLSITFNSMIQKVQDWYLELEEQVTARTEQLNSANKDLELEISERKKAEKELKQYRDHLEDLVNERTRELETFSYSISHDLKAPLRAISGFADILLEDYSGSIDDEGKRKLDVIRSNAANMGQLINDILSYSQMGRQNMKKTDIDMEKLARDTFDSLQKGLTGHKINSRVNSLPTCKGDLTMMRQMLTNLLSNAIKFSGKTEPAEIEIGSKYINEEPVYYIKDNGVGFDMRYSGKLFGLFERLHSTQEFEGTGVGLAIVQRLIRRHGGRIWAEGKVDEGATFYFTLGEHQA